jgi:hypothetical protein
MKEKTASILKRVAKVSLICSLLVVLLGCLGLALTGDEDGTPHTSQARLNLFCLVLFIDWLLLFFVVLPGLIITFVCGLLSCRSKQHRKASLFLTITSGTLILALVLVWGLTA